MSEDRSSNGQKSWLGKLTQAFAHEPKNRQELLELLREAHQNKLLDSEALAIVEGAIQVADLQVRDIMVPRSQMISIKATQTPREFLPAIIDAAHSRYPVIGESHDDVMGVLLAKDLLPLILKENGDSFNIKDLLRPATFVPESKRLNVLLREFRANHNHMAIVIDEYGGTAGMITRGDILDEIVESVDNEFGGQPTGMQTMGENCWLIHGNVSLEDINYELDLELEAEGADRLAGWVTARAEHIPRVGEVVEAQGCRVTVRQMKKHRITMLLLEKLAST